MPNSFARQRSSTTLCLYCVWLLSACGDDSGAGPTRAAQDAGQVDLNTPLDGGSSLLDAGRSASAETELDGGRIPAQRADGTKPSSEAIPRPACQLLTTDEVAAITGVPMAAQDGAGGQQCVFRSTDPAQPDVAVLLEEAPNGKVIFLGTLAAYASAGMLATPESGIGDQATFTTNGPLGCSMQTTVGDLVLRLNIGWAEPGVATELQRSSARQLLGLALGRL